MPGKMFDFQHKQVNTEQPALTLEIQTSVAFVSGRNDRNRVKVFYSWVFLSSILMKSQEHISKDKATIEGGHTEFFWGDHFSHNCYGCQSFSGGAQFHFISVLSVPCIQLIEEKSMLLPLKH